MMPPSHRSTLVRTVRYLGLALTLAVSSLANSRQIASEDVPCPGHAGDEAAVAPGEAGHVSIGERPSGIRVAASHHKRPHDLLSFGALSLPSLHVIGSIVASSGALHGANRGLPRPARSPPLGKYVPVDARHIPD